MAAGVERMFTTEGLGEFLAGAEVLVNVAPSTAATRGLLGGGALAACNGAVLVSQHCPVGTWLACKAEP